jgi:cytochrome P450
MLVAGHETTQVSLCGVLYYLAKFNEWQHRLYEEVCRIFPSDSDFLDYERFQNFTSLGNFILESLRVYSPLANQNRRMTNQVVELNGYHIPKGTYISMNIHAIHFNPSEWDNPYLFDPSRFHNEKPTKAKHWPYLPFGAGARVCVGKQITIIEQKIVISLLLKHFFIELKSPQYAVPIQRGSFTGLPDDSFTLVFKRRQQ